MRIEKKDLPGSLREIIVELSAEEFAVFYDQGAKKAGEKIKIEGFRPGMAPVNLIKSRLGEMPILESAAEIAIDKKTKEILQQESLEDLYLPPQMELLKLAPNNPLVFKLIFTLFPKVEINDYAGLNFKREEIKVAPNEKDRVIQDLQEMTATEVVVDRPVKNSDKVILDINMYLDNVPIDGGQAKGVAIILGKNYLVPGFDEKIIGLKKGDQREFDLIYPTDHYQKNLAGKRVEFKVKCLDVFERTLPIVDDNFARRFGAKDKDDLIKNIEHQIYHDHERENERKLEQKIFDELLSRTRFGDIPQAMIDQELQYTLKDLEHQIEDQGGKFEDYLTSIKKSRAQLALDLTPEAIRRIKISLLIRYIYKKEGIKVEPEEIKREKEKLLEVYRDQPNVVKRIEDPDYERYLINQIAERKTILRLKELNISPNSISLHSH